jgi:hypothetical protein
MFATGALAACGGNANNVPASPPTSSSAASSCIAATATAVNALLSDPVFKNVDKAAVAALFDHSANIAALLAGYSAQPGAVVQTETVIRSIPSAGIVIRSPGTYTLGGNILWTPNNVQCAAITISSSNVTLDLGGYTLTAAVPDKSQRIAGILVAAPVSGPGITNVSISNGTVANASEYGVLAVGVCGLKIANVNVSGLSLQNLNTRFLTPAGIQVSAGINVEIAGCSVTQSAVTTDSSAGIMLLQSIQAKVSGCRVSGLVNNDGAVQGYSLISCINVTTTGCTADTLQSHFNGNVLTSGHTVLGFCPILCTNLSYVDCSASGLTGCCDDCHGMSVFLDGQVTVTRFHAENVVDGVAASNSGAKATGLEVYGVGVTVTDSTVNNIKAINPQDRQSAGFTAWGLSIQFQRCGASNVTVQKDLIPESHGVGFAWAPDPRSFFCNTGAFNVTYTDCSADRCDVGFDTWFHVNSTWTRPVFTNCTTGILVQPGATRTLSADPCSECNPAISVTLTNIASGNVFPQ